MTVVVRGRHESVDSYAKRVTNSPQAKRKRLHAARQAEDYPPELKFGPPAPQEPWQASTLFANSPHSQEEIDAANEMRKRRCGERDD